MNINNYTNYILDPQTKLLIHVDKPRNLFGNDLIKYKTNLKLNVTQKEILVGSLLGDGYFNYNRFVKQPKYCFCFAQGIKSANYVDHMYQIFKPFVGTAPKATLIGGIAPGLPKRYDVRFKTYGHEEFKSYYDLFYPQVLGSKVRKKCVPENISELLTAKGLAYWYMDDGTSHSTTTKSGIKRNYVISTQGFCYNDQVILINSLNQRFNLNVSIHKDKTYFRLAINSSSSKHFYYLIKPYILPDFYYKL